MTKLLAFILITCSLGLAAVTATTAYRWSTDLPDTEFQLDPSDTAPAPDAYVELKANAGGAPKSLDNPAGTPPVATASTLDKPTYLNPAMLTTLRAAGIDAVLVKTFRFGNWEHRFAFIASVVGLLAGGLLMRMASKPAKGTERAAQKAEAPGLALSRANEEIDALIAGLRGLSDDSLRCDAIVKQLGETLQTHLAAFVDGRDALVGRIGLARYAGLMDRFAGAERTLNRAWSAAADGHDPEAMACLTEGASLMKDTEALHDELTGRDAA